MNPPIPDPFSGPPPRAPRQMGPRPAALKTFIGVSLMSTLISGVMTCLVPTEPSSETEPAFSLGLLAAYTLLWLTFLWFLWLGRNWSRIAVMVGCALEFVSVGLIGFVGQEQGSYALVHQILIVLNCVFGFVWFLWLRSPKVVAFYKGTVA